MRRTQKFLSVFLALMMVLSIVPITASATDVANKCGDNLTWSFDETTGTLTISGEGAMYDYPYDDSQWYELKSEITNVVIEDGVASIGDSAFELFVNLISITIPESVTVIGAYAFGDCDSLTKIVLHEGVTKIGDGAFANCDYLDTVVIPGTVTEFGDYGFANCDRLANVTLCNGLTDIGLDTFNNCISLTDIVIPESITNLRGGNFAGCVNLKSITIPVTLTGVGYGVFGDCVNLQDVYYTGTEEDILKLHPFGYNEPLFAANIHCESAVHTHNYVKTGEYVAEFCHEDGYITYTCECGHTYKGDYVKATEHSYDNGSVTTKPTCDVDGVKTFTCTTCGDTYTEAVSKTGHSYDDGVITTEPTCTTDGIKTFTCECCGDTYTESVDKVSEHSYELVVNTSPETTGCIKMFKCSICGDEYTETVNATGHNQVIIPEFAPTESRPGLTAGIACSSCGAVILQQEVIPALGTTDDSSVIISGTCGTNATWTYNTETCALIISGTGAMERYKSTQNKPWEKYKDSIKTVIINDGITKIDNYTFNSCSALMYVSIPDSVTAIGNYVFRNCKNLRSVTIPDGVTSLGDELFKNCSNLINVEIGNKASQIGASAFNGCSSLTKVTIPDSVYYIYASAFENCSNLKSVTIGKNVTTIYNKAFNGCTALTDVYYVGTEEQWKEISIDTTGNDALGTATIHFLGEVTNQKFTGIKDNHFYKDDVMQKAYQLVEFDGDFYYIGDRHEIVKDKKVYIKAERTNDLTFADGTPISAGWYEFDADGKMIILDGVVGNKVYKNNVQLKAYQLVEVDGDFYYIGDRHEIVKNKRVYIKSERINGLTYADGTPITAGYYEFDENGKMIILDGIVGNKVYKNNVQLKAYQLVEVDGEFYYIGDRHEIVKDKKVYIKAERTNGLTFADGTPIQAGWYNFDADGKLINE